MSATGEASNVEYVTARVRHRRAALFDADDYRRLLRMGPGEIARFMEETEYEREVNALGARHAGVDLIEYALNRNLARHFEDLLRWCEGPLYDQVSRYLRKFDAWNLKTVLRGIYSDVSAEAIRTDLIRAGELDEVLLEQLSEAGSIEAAVELARATPFGDALADAYDDYEETGLLVPLENAVDRSYYEGLLSETPQHVEVDRATGLFIDFLQAEIDFRNLRNALRLVRSGADIDPGEFYISGGKLFEATDLRSLVAEGDVESLATRIRESEYGDDLAEALDDLEGADSLIRFEHDLEAALLDYSRHLSYVFPLSICPVLAYILAKEREVDNVRAIARGREAGLSESDLEDELVML